MRTADHLFAQQECGYKYKSTLSYIYKGLGHRPQEHDATTLVYDSLALGLTLKGQVKSWQVLTCSFVNLYNNSWID